MSGERKNHLNVAICHPDLGIGGAERLIIDAALELASRGYSVTIFTNYHDTNRCFPETVDGGIPVKVYGEFIPRHLFHRFHALFAYLRFIYLAICLLLFEPRMDLVFADQISAAIPIFRLKAKVLFYCHFPDLLLANRSNFLKKLYRTPIDWLEEITTGMSNLTVVNSEFTRDTFAITFPKLAKHGNLPQVLYPSVNLESFSEGNRMSNGFTKEEEEVGETEKKKENVDGDREDETTCFKSFLPEFPPDAKFFLSINRFERKKNLELSIYAFSILKKRQKREADEVDFSISSSSASNFASNSRNFCLVLAGGYDERLTENREYLKELQNLSQSLEIANSVFFLPSFSDHQKRILLSQCICVLYTPQNEHFGIVPLEAMASSRAVIACNNGGPVETVVPNHCGFLCEPTPQNFASAMETLLRNPQLASDMGIRAREHVKQTFSREQFGERLDHLLHLLLQ